MKTNVFCLCAILAVTVPAALLAQPAETVLEEKLESLDGERWATSYPAKTSLLLVGDGQAELRNGATIVTQRGWSKVTTISTTWTWSGANDAPSNADALSILIRANGKAPRTITKCLRVVVEAGIGELRVEAVDKDVVTILDKKSVRVESNKDLAGLPEGAGSNWYQLRVQDDSKKLRVWFGAEEKPALEVPYDANTFSAGYVGFQNGPKPSDTDRISYLRALRISEK